MLAPLRVVAVVVLVAGVVGMVAVLMEYDHSVASGVVDAVEAWLQGVGAPAWVIASDRVEFALNVAMFVPVVFLASLVLPRQRWANWVVYGFVASCLVELVQGLYLPPRSAQFSDVVANTLGALIGAVLAGVLWWLLRRRVGARR